MHLRKRLLVVVAIAALCMIGSIAVAFSPPFAATAHAVEVNQADGTDLGGGPLDPNNAAGAGTNSKSSSDNNSHKCLYSFGLNIWECLMQGGNLLALLFLEFALLFLAIAGTLLDISLQLLAFGMGGILKNQGIAQALEYGWTILRDLGNLALIASLIWASITMILGLSAMGHKPGKLIANILIVALLLNFSYLFAGALIDASNALSKTIYNYGIKSLEGSGQLSIGGKALEGAATATGANKLLANLSVSGDAFAGIFIQQTNLLSVIPQKPNFDKPFFSIIAMGYATTLVTVTAVVFTEAAALIIMRFVILVLLLVLSPVYVLGFTQIGDLKKWGDWWWKTMVSQLVFLPAFVLLIMISFNTIGATMTLAAKRTNGATLANAIDGAASGQQGLIAAGWELTIFFFVSLALLQISIKVARDLATGAEVKLPDLGQFQQMASKGGQAVGKLGQKWVAGFPAEMAGIGYDRLQPYLPAGNLGKGVSRTLRSLLGQGKDVEREKRAERRVEHELDESLREVQEWKDRLAEAKAPRTDKDGNVIPADPGAIRAAEQGLSEAKSKYKSNLKEYHDKFGDHKTARRIEAIGDEAYKNAYQKAIKAGKSAEDAYKEAQQARLAAQDAALDSLGEDAHKVEKLVRQGGGTSRASRKRGSEGSDGGGSSTAAAVRELKPELRALADRIVRKEQEAIAQLADLSHEERQELFLARREILRDRENTKLIVDKLGGEKFGAHLAEMPAVDLKVNSNLAEHMTPEAYQRIRARRDLIPTDIDGLNRNMRARGKGDIIDKYEANNPKGRRDSWRK